MRSLFVECAALPSGKDGVAGKGKHQGISHGDLSVLKQATLYTGLMGTVQSQW